MYKRLSMGEAGAALRQTSMSALPAVSIAAETTSLAISIWAITRSGGSPPPESCEGVAKCSVFQVAVAPRVKRHLFLRVACSTRTKQTLERVLWTVMMLEVSMLFLVSSVRNLSRYWSEPTAPIILTFMSSWEGSDNPSAAEVGELWHVR